MQRQAAVLPTAKNLVAPSLAAQVMLPRAAARKAHVQLTAPRPAALSNKNIFEIRSSVHLLNRGHGRFFYPLHIKVVKYAISPVVHDSAD